MSPGDPN
ncbi:hypothetical protein N7500_009423 [Penicillium coprophilum]|nr:hypothetical protein N7500_009423 [Penicillium coprophilum]